MNEQIGAELIRLIPTIIWASIVVLALLLFRGAIRDQFLPRVTRLTAFGLEIEASVRERLELVAESTPESVGGSEQRTQVARRASRLTDITRGAQYLLVNDEPRQMSDVVRLLSEMGISVTTTTSTEEALHALSRKTFNVVNSDMRRGPNLTAGLDLIQEMCALGYRQPVILTVGKYEPEKGVPPFTFGITNRIDELLNLVFDALERARG